MRSVFHSLPFQAIPSIMIKYLAVECTQKLKFFPPKGGTSPYYSPDTIIHRRRLNYDKHCRIPQFSYVIAHNEPQKTNTPAARGKDCLYLRPLIIDNVQGGHALLNLATMQVITHTYYVTPVPMPSSVISAVEHAAKKDNMLAIVFRTKHNVI
jgi:hypothetical protein